MVLCARDAARQRMLRSAAGRLLAETACSTGGLLESVQQSEGLRRDGACEHGVLQHRAAGEAVLHEPSHACVLMHVGAVQASTRLQIGPRVRPAARLGRFNRRMFVLYRR